ncbi:MAG: ComF family protein [Pyrinomonadaceae bacterium]
MNLLNPVLSLLFPEFCSICGAVADEYSNGAICAVCWFETEVFDPRAACCPKCGRLHPKAPTNIKSLCTQCADLHFDKARSCGRYGGALAELILKAKHKPHYPAKIYDLLAEAYLSGTLDPSDIIIPIPLSKRRFFERGFNQAELLAENLAKRIGLPVDSGSLIRKRHVTKSRAVLDAKGRESSVRGAFAVRRVNLIVEQRILLLDDVFTSGATVSTAAKALKRAGAASVNVLTIARA